MTSPVGGGDHRTGVGRRFRLVCLATDKDELFRVAVIEAANRATDTLDVRVVLAGKAARSGADVTSVGLAADAEIFEAPGGPWSGGLTGTTTGPIERWLAASSPDALLIAGDSSTAAAFALAAFWAGIPIVNLDEARPGQRPGGQVPRSLDSGNRRLVTAVASLNMVADREAVERLLEDGYSNARVHLVGSTSAEMTVRCFDLFGRPELPRTARTVLFDYGRADPVPVKGDLERSAVGLALEFPTYRFVVVEGPSRSWSRSRLLVSAPSNLEVVRNLDALELNRLLGRSRLVVTHEAGCRVEAVAAGVPVIVTHDEPSACEGQRSEAHQSEGHQSGGVRNVSTTEAAIRDNVARLLVSPEDWSAMADECGPAAGEPPSALVVEAVNRYLEGRYRTVGRGAG